MTEAKENTKATEEVVEKIKVEKNIIKTPGKKEEKKKAEVDYSGWKPKTEIGRKVKNEEIKDLGEILDKGQKILESEIVDILVPELESDLILIGQAKGKFGGGQRRVFKQTQKKTKEGNNPSFATYAVVGNRNGYVGMGYGKSKETVPAREKAIRKAKLNVFKIRRGSGSWESDEAGHNSIPYTVEGKCGSVKVKLMPAPRGKGLVIEKECAKVLQMAGIQDIWSKTSGKTKSKINLIRALEKALRKLAQTKVTDKVAKKLGIVEGAIKK